MLYTYDLRVKPLQQIEQTKPMKIRLDSFLVQGIALQANAPVELRIYVGDGSMITNR